MASQFVIEQNEDNSNTIDINANHNCEKEQSYVVKYRPEWSTRSKASESFQYNDWYIWMEPFWRQVWSPPKGYRLLNGLLKLHILEDYIYNCLN